MSTPEERNKRKSRYLWACFGLLILIIAFTIFVTLLKLYVFEITLPISLHESFSLGDHFSTVIQHFQTFLIILFAAFFGAIITFLIYVRGGVASIEAADDGHMISQVLWLAIRENWKEIAVLTCITILVLFNIMAWMDDISRTSPTSAAPIFIGLSLTLFSVGVTTIGMYYAFLAEKKAHLAQKSAEKLLVQKSYYLNNFQAFIDRINRKITCDDNGNQESLYFDILAAANGNEHIQFNIKCIYLTPFLGHAGSSGNNANLIDASHRNWSYIQKYFGMKNVNIKIITQEHKEVLNLYSQILWLEKLKGTTNKTVFTNFTKPEKLRVMNDTQQELIKMGVTGYGAGSEMKSYKDLVAEFERVETNLQATNLPINWKISEFKHIPYQMFLVTTNVTQNNDEDEQGLFVVLTFVGSDTYRTLVDDVAKGTYKIDNKVGVEHLLRKLHAAFYIDDAMICNTLNRHFEHMWNLGNEVIVPTFDEQLWVTIPNSALPSDCTP